MLDRGHHLLDVVGLHPGAGNGYDGAVVQKLAEDAASVRLRRVVLRHAARDLRRLGEHLQRAVGCEVEGVAVGLHLAAEVAGALHAEDRLHVLCGGRDRASGDHQDGRPFGHRHAGRELAARERDGILVLADGLLHQFEGTVEMPLFVVVALAGDVGDAVPLEIPVLAQQGGKRLGRRDAWHHPERMAEEVAVFLRGEWIAAFRAVAGYEIKEAPHVIFMHEVADFRVLRYGMVVDLLIAGPRAEELAEVERLAFKVLFRETVKLRAEVVRVEVEARQGGVGIGFIGVFFVPRLLPLLFHHVVPDENRIIVVLRENIKRCAGKREDFRVLLDEMFADFLAKIGLRSFVRLVNDHEVPVHVEDAAVLVVLAVYDLRTAQVLN